MTAPDEERVQKRAHEIWEREGRPSGQETCHWEQAKGEIETEDAVTTVTGQQIGDGGLSRDIQAGGTNPGSGPAATAVSIGTGGGSGPGGHPEGGENDQIGQNAAWCYSPFERDCHEPAVGKSLSAGAPPVGSLS